MYAGCTAAYGGGLNKITDKADIVYSVANPNVGSINMIFTSPAASVDLGPIPTTPNSFGTITHNFASTDPQCAYLVTLTATYLLTTGDENLPSVQDKLHSVDNPPAGVTDIYPDNIGSFF